MCILSFQELRKHEEGDFPPICPYAYAYVLWKHSLLRTPKFYCNKTMSGDISRRYNDRSSYLTKLIANKIDYIKKYWVLR